MIDNGDVIGLDGGMPRAPRIEFAGAIYHVMNRGNQLESIFRDDVDRGIFIKTLEETCEGAGWKAHSFVLMNNHYHLLVETLRPTLVKGMQYLNSTYTRRHNVRHKTFGHLFQGRYKALLVDGEEKGYFLMVSDYIHMNPVRAKVMREAKELLKDPWSSAGWLSGSRKGKPQWLEWRRVYGELGLKNWKGRWWREYRCYLERRMAEVKGDEEGWKKIRRGWCLGGESFVSRMKEKLEEIVQEPREPDSWAGAAVEEMEKDRAQRLLEQGAGVLGYPQPGEVRGEDRYLLGKWIRHQTRVRVPWLAQKLRLQTRGGMSHGITQITRRLDEDGRLKKKWKTLLISQNVA